jgi:Asp-tRNA(Asn)/Glu-tRNA(Gln) amidotransferase A subunit family amidase
MLLGVLAGADPADPLSVGEPRQTWRTDAVDVSHLRVAWSADFGYGGVDPEVRALCESAVRRLADLGAVVEDCDPTWEDPGEFHRVLYSVGLATALADRALEHPDWIEVTLQDLIDEGLSHSARDLKTAEVQRSVFYDAALAFFGRFDVLISPTMPLPAWPLTTGEGPLEVAGHSLAAQRRSLFAYPFNLTGQPALTLPCGFHSSGLPVGVQVVARWRRDDVVLAVGAALEAALDLRLPLADPRVGIGGAGA